jgi:hypothetical protein
MAKYAMVAATDLQVDDEVKFDTGRTVTVTEVDENENGVFVEFSDGEGGYVRPDRQFRVIS